MNPQEFLLVFSTIYFVLVGTHFWRRGAATPPPKRSVEFWELPDRIIRVETIEENGYRSHEFYVERGPDLTFEEAARFIKETCAELSARGITCIAHYVPGSEERP
jgi:hypothetical protein